MKCPSCGVWNRAHFTKCFRCGAELSDAAKPETAVAEPAFIDDEPATEAVRYQEPVSTEAEPVPQPEEDLEVYSLYDNGDWDDEDEEDNEAVFGIKVSSSAQPKPVPEAAPLPGPVQPKLVEAKDSFIPAADEDEEDNEPATVYQAPVKAPAPEEMTAQEETRKFAPIVSDAADGATRKFDLAADTSSPLSAQPAPVPVEPEVAPMQPGISHEIIHAIFTNPPSGIQTDVMPEPVDEPRPRKLMSRTRLPAPAVEEEPATVYKKAVSDKPEPRVDNLDAFKPTARMAARIADEKGDEYTAFATAERKLVAEVTDADPFNAAFDIPRAVQNAEEEIELPQEIDASESPDPIKEMIAEDPAPIAETETASEVAEHKTIAEPEAQPEIISAAVKSPVREPDIAPVIIEPAVQPAAPHTVQEQPAWVKEALLNLGSPDVDSLHTVSPARSHTVRTFSNVQLNETARTEEVSAVNEEPATRYERPARPTQAGPDFHALERTAPRANREPAIAAQPMPRPARRTEAPETYAAPARTASPRPRVQHSEQPIAAPRARAPYTAQAPQRSARPAAQQPQLHRADKSAQPAPARVNRDLEMPERPQPRPRPQHPANRAQNPAQRPAASASGQKTDSKPGLKNPLLLIPIGIAALLILALLIWGGVSLIKGAVGMVKDKLGQSTEQPADQLPGDDVNAPTVVSGTVNGRPGHIITFTGNDNDIIYISNENLANSYNIPIVGGVGTLELEDSILIGNRFVTEDVEITLNPVLHEAGSGKETPLSPVTFTVTPPDAYLEIVSPAGGVDETTLGTYQVKVRVELGSQVTIAGNVVSDMIAQEDNGLGSIVYNVSVEPTGENNIPIVVQKEGCKSITEYITLKRPVMTVPIELDAATPSTVTTDSLSISGKVEAGVQVKVYSPISGELDSNSDGSFSFTAKLEKFGENEIVIRAEKGDDSSELIHTVTYNPTFNDYVAKAWAMDYEALDNYAGQYKPFKCSGKVVEVLQQEPYTCIFNVGSDSNPKHIYLEMVPGKPLSTDMEYDVYADTHADGTKDSYPYMIGRFFVEAN